MLSGNLFGNGEGSMILACSCKHEWQDRQYGQGRRYHTTTVKGTFAGKKVYRCTVCGVEREK